MAPSDNFAQTLKLQADIVRIVGDYVSLKKAGAQNFSGLCPFHKEKTPSFSVHATRQFFHCFGCGASGDVFAFVQKIENITFPEAVRSVAQRLNIQLRKPEAARAREYLKARELSDEAVGKFRLGFAPDSGFLLRDYLRAKFSDDLLKLSGLFSWKDEPNDGDAQQRLAMYSKFRSRITFPITNEQ